MSMLRNVSIVMRGMIIAQAVGLVALPLLTRLLPVEAFGQFQAFGAVIAVGLVFAAMRYELALFRCHTAAELRATVHLCFAINLAIAVGGGVAYQLVRAFGGSSTVSGWAFNGFMLGAGLLLAGLVQTLFQLVVRAEAFGTGARARELQALVYAGGGVGLGFAAPRQAALIWADLAARAVALGLLLAHRAKLGLPSLLPVQPRRIAAVAKKYRSLALWTVPSSMISVLSGTIITIGIFFLYGPASAGQFGLVERSILLPANLFAVAVQQVYTAKLAKELRESGGEALSLYRQTLKRLFLLGTVPAILIFFGSSQLFIFVFGPQWAPAGSIATMLAPFLLINFVAGSVNLTLVIAGAQRRHLAWEVARVTAMGVAWAVVIAAELSLELAVALNYLVHVLCYIVYFFMSDRVLRDADRFRRKDRAADLEMLASPLV
jgi:O-antigen/teichoic acid export membrane protein